MKDKLGRKIEYLRISVTDRCNLRCRYCMPAEGVESVCHQDILRFDEIERLAEIFAGLGVKKIKVTGGEPLVRKNLSSLIKALKDIDGIEQVTLTTNGVRLEEELEGLKAAGIDCINVSLDSLDRGKYEKITGGDHLDKVLKGIDLALEMGIRLKINVVCIKGFNEDEIADFGRLARDKNIDVRFIELMPVGLGAEFEGCQQEQIIGLLKEAYGKAALYEGAAIGNGPAVYYEFEGFKGRIGFISAMSHRFCESCNRVRLTSQGFLKTCLQYGDGVDLREAMRGAAGAEVFAGAGAAGGTAGAGADAELKELIRDAVFNKPACHSFNNGSAGEFDQRKMYDIGG